MPGPRNQKKQRGSDAKKSKKKSGSKTPSVAVAYAQVIEVSPTGHTLEKVTEPTSELDVSFRALSLETAYMGAVSPKNTSKSRENASRPVVPSSLDTPSSPAEPSPLHTPPPPSLSLYSYTDGLPPPCIEDPGSGPRVRDALTFLASPFAVKSAEAADAPLCAELAQDEVLSMIQELLPTELALTVWYNRTRRSSRICPACQRLYTLGDVLPDHFSAEDPEGGQKARVGQRKPSPQLNREQALSGLCSPVCFALASYNHQHVVHSVWGASGTRPWRLLASPSRNPPASDGGLGLAVRMTRRADLGLGQLLGFSPDDEPEYEDGGWEEWNTPLNGCDNLDLLGKSPKIGVKRSNPGSLDVRLASS